MPESEEMSHPNGDTPDDPLLDLALAGTPERVTDVFAPDPAQQAELGAHKSALAHLAYALPLVAPSAALRQQVLERLERLARTEGRVARRALIVMDMINDYLTPGRPLEVARARAIVPAVQRRLAEARREGDVVIYLHDEHEANDPDLAAWPVHAVRGSEGAKIWPEIAPEPGDVLIPHRTYSGFFGTDLEAQLRAFGVRSLVITGCATEIGMFATATDALMRGFSVDVPADSQAGASEATERATLAMLHVMRPLEPMPAG